MKTDQHSAGSLLRQWRQRRRYSQLALAVESEIPQRHLSFIESGRSKPSRDMLIRLAQQLDVPLRERNIMLLAAGFAPVYGERRLASPELAAARDTIEHLLSIQVPHPALAVDRHWTLISPTRPSAFLLRARRATCWRAKSTYCA
jgi:transcriptional regulator with XRE-family HTH domain